MEQNIRENKMGTRNVNSLLLSMAIPMMISIIIFSIHKSNVISSIPT